MPRVFLLLPLIALGACATQREPAPYSFMDTDRDRRISVAEMRTGLTTVVHGIADSDADGEVTFAEIAAAYPPADPVEFAASDTDGTGTLSLTELHEAIDRSGAFRELMNDIDVDGDSVIDPAEAARFHDAMVTAQSADDVTKIAGIVDAKAAGEVNSAFGKMLGYTAQRRRSVFYDDPLYRYGTFGYPFPGRPYYYRPHRPFRPNRPARPPRPIKNPVARPVPEGFRPRPRPQPR